MLTLGQFEAYFAFVATKYYAEKMAKGIKLAAKYEKRYLRCTTNRGKAKVIDEFHRELGVKFDVTDNFRAMLNLLSGEL